MGKRLRKSWILLFCFIIQPVWASSESLKFISIADIHFNPLFQCDTKAKSCSSLDKLEEARYQDWSTLFETTNDRVKAYENTNYYLFKQTLLKLESVAKEEKPKFVLLLGDYLSHQLRKQYKKLSKNKTQAGYEKFVKKTLQYLGYELNKVFPNIDIYPTVGNHDTYGSNYQVIPGGAFLKEMGESWSILIKEPKNRALFRKEFPEAGYYHVFLQDNKHILIMLNTVLFATKNKMNSKNAALKELKWAKTILDEAKALQDKVLFAYHIPSGIDLQSTLVNKFNHTHEFWKPIYKDALKELLENYKGEITGMLVGHLHTDRYPSLTFTNFGNFPIIVTPSITPIFGNEPGFKVIELDLKDDTLDNASHYYSLLSHSY